MSRYHINPENGNPGRCKALVSCPFGDMELDHYSSRAEAQKAYEQAMEAAALGQSHKRDSTLTFPNTYEFPASRIEEAVASIDKANNKAKKAGIRERIKYKIETYEVRKLDANGLEQVEERARLVLNRPTLQHNGWTFAGTMTWDEEVGLVTRMVPGEKVLEDVRAKVCDVCNTTRHRKDTYLVQRGKEQKQVGSNCLKQFMGIAPESLWMLDYEPDMFKQGGNLEPAGGVPWGEQRRDSVEMLGLGLAAVETYGWTSRSAAYGDKQATVDRVEAVLTNAKHVPEAEKLRLISRGKALQHEAKEMLTYARELEGDSDYVQNLRAIASGDSVSMRNLPLFLSAIGSARREQAQAVEKEAKAKSAHQGVVGEKLSVPRVTVEDTKVIESNYGYQTTYSTLVTMVDEQGNRYKTFYGGSNTPQKGETYELPSSTVKKHESWNGVDETLLSRVKFKQTRPSTKPPTALSSTSAFHDTWTLDEVGDTFKKENARIKREIKKLAGKEGWDKDWDRPTDRALLEEWDARERAARAEYNTRYNELTKED